MGAGTGARKVGEGAEAMFWVWALNGLQFATLPLATGFSDNQQ